MLKDLSYKDLEIEKEINNLIGKEFNLLEKLCFFVNPKSLISNLKSELKNYKFLKVSL